jgi:hypothetical protein
MPPAVIARVNLLGKEEPSILTFTDQHGWEIDDYPQDLEPTEDDDTSFGMVQAWVGQKRLKYYILRLFSNRS